MNSMSSISSYCHMFRTVASSSCEMLLHSWDKIYWIIFGYSRMQKRLFSPTSRSTSVEISQPTSERNSWACTTIHGSLISINSQKPILKVVGCCLSFLPDADQGHYDWQKSASDPPHPRYSFSRSIYAIFMSGPHCSKRERRPGPVHRGNLQSIRAPTIWAWKKPGKLPATLLEPWSSLSVMTPSESIFR